jgi:hypothetical protein
MKTFSDAAADGVIITAVYSGEPATSSQWKQFEHQVVRFCSKDTSGTLILFKAIAEQLDSTLPSGKLAPKFTTQRPRARSQRTGEDTGADAKDGWGYMDVELEQLLQNSEGLDPQAATGYAQAGPYASGAAGSGPGSAFTTPDQTVACDF